ncbi:MAG: DegV family protein [Acidobacteriota bacterium]
MARPTVLVVDGDDTRRRALGRGLAELGYEAILAENASNGMRFAVGLSPQVIVAAGNLEGFGDLRVLTLLTPTEDGGRSTLILLDEQDRAAEPELPENGFALTVGGLTPSAVLRKVRVCLVGMEVGLEPDERLESLVGDLQLIALFDLLPMLQKSVVTGRLIMAEGEIALHDGEVIGARCGGTRGVKAFARLGRIAGGTFRLLLGPAGTEPEIDQDLLSLMAVAMEDQHRYREASDQLPDWESRLRIELGAAFFSTHFTPAQQEVLQGAQGGRTIRALLEAAQVPDGETLEELLHLRAEGFVKFEVPEIRVLVVTDSTADLSAELAHRHRIHVVPLSVIFGDQIYRDGVDLTPGAFYRMLERRRDVHPRTSPPGKGEFSMNYRSILERSDVVSVHISEKMSQTVVHAREALEEGRDALLAARREGTRPVLEVTDSTQVSVGLGVLVLFAARMAHRGLAATEIRRRIDEMRPRLHLLFVVDTLEYLARGGRIGKARAWLGGLLGIKPILGVIDGEVTPVDRVRGGRQAQPRLLELLKQRVDADRPVIVGTGHAAAPVWADRLRGLIEESFQVLELVQGEIGPVVGTHVGPGCVGAAMFQPTEEEIPLLAPLPVES